MIKVIQIDAYESKLEDCVVLEFKIPIAMLMEYNFLEGSISDKSAINLLRFLLNEAEKTEETINVQK